MIYTKKIFFLILFIILLILQINYKTNENFNNINEIDKINSIKNELLNKYELFFQYPAITEKICNEQNKSNPKYLGIPWATIIDKRLDKEIYNFLKSKNYRIEEDNFVSACQHISFKKILKIAKLLGINKMYISHKIKGEEEIDGIRLKPLPIYAVNVENESKNQIFKNKDFLSINRKYLFSFMGAVYLRAYLTDIRKNIYENRNNYPNDTYFENTGQWHFQDVVYKEQTKNIKLDNKKKKKELKNTQKYNNILLNSRYSLCPSGSGPNTIRFWESLAIGSIPILLSDTFELPYHKLWKEAIIIIDEKNYKNINNILSSINLEQEKKMRRNCIKIYNYFKNNFLNNL